MRWRRNMEAWTEANQDPTMPGNLTTVICVSDRLPKWRQAEWDDGDDGSLVSVSLMIDFHFERLLLCYIIKVLHRRCTHYTTHTPTLKLQFTSIQPHTYTQTYAQQQCWLLFFLDSSLVASPALKNVACWCVLWAQPRPCVADFSPIWLINTSICYRAISCLLHLTQFAAH